MAILPTIKKNWQILPNQLQAGEALQLTHAQKLLYNIKTAFLGTAGLGWYAMDGSSITTPTGGATIESSSDSSSYGSSDYITDSTKLIWSFAASPYSWMVLNFPSIISTGNFCLYIGCRDGSPWDLEMYAFPTGVGTPGTTTTRPSATDEVAIMTAGSPRWGAPSIINLETRWHFWIADDGTGFRMCMSRWGYDTIWFELQTLEDSQFADGWIVNYWGSGDKTTPGQTATATLQQYTQTARFRTVISSTAVNVNLTYPTLWGGAYAPPAKSTITNNWQLYPVACASFSGNYVGPLGSLTDVYHTQSALNYQSPDYTNNGGGGFCVCYGDNYQFAQLAGAFSFPWVAGMKPLIRHF